MPTDPRIAALNRARAARAAARAAGTAQPSRNAQTWRYGVTFEFDSRPPLTHNGLVTANSHSNLCARAIKTARRALHPVNVRSMVCVLLERLPEHP